MSYGEHLRTYLKTIQNTIRVQRFTVRQGECRSHSVSLLFAPMGKWSVGVGRRHLIIMRKASFKTLSKRQVSALRYQTGAQYSAVEQTRNRTAVHSALALTFYPEAKSRLSSVTRGDSFFAQCHKIVTKRERSVKFYPKISRGWTEQ